MPRTLPAALTTVMDAGAYEPYLRVMVNDVPADEAADTVLPLAFTLEPLTASVKIARFTNDLDAMIYFRIIRGALINGTPSTISSIWFKVISTTYDGKFVTLKGEIAAKEYLTVAADSDYQTVIEAALTRESDTIVPSYEGTATWKAYQFYPTGRTIILSPIKRIFTLLQQKYLVFATEDGWNGEENTIFFFVATQTRATDYTFTDLLFNGNEHIEVRKLISRDEASTIHSTGGDDSIIHNLGFLESTANQPDTVPVINSFVGARSSKLPVHLKYRTGDQAICNGDGSSLNTMSSRIKVTEVLDLQSTPAWYQIIEALVWYGTTEGGPMPSTIEAAAPYTPLATGNFNGILSANDNNLQAAMETIDDHNHDADYAPAAEGVTNGDSHDHNGGDGAAIAFANITGKKVLLPFGVFGAISPMAVAADPYGTSLDRTITPVSLTHTCIVTTTNDGSNYWRIRLLAISGGTVATVTTAAVAADTWVILTTSSFSISPITTSNVGLYVEVDKVGSPGPISIFGPMFEVTIS